ncbi:hypothetical protein [Phaeovulum sp. W22_SRMD_FR3]|uniref:hypothetical protein n=1 Tax=Phaeovulum sp. W22_SRMD_FR3 TaxID=3240274 RepID=UPI003F9CD336
MASIPAAEREFRTYLERAGYIDIDARYPHGGGREALVFTISTGFGSGHTVHLFSHARPEPRTFTSVKALSTILARWGFAAVAVPVNSGTHRCYLHTVPSAEEDTEAASKGISLPGHRLRRTASG